MAKNSAEFVPKDRINHYVFGVGTVVEVNDRYTTIAFDEAGTRKFMSSIVKLEPSDSPAPVRPALRRTKKTKSSKRSSI